MDNYTNNFNWSEERNTRMTGVAHDQAKALRVARRVLNLVGTQGIYVESVAGHRVDPGPLLSIRPNQHLQPLQISRRFHLFREQTDDETLETLIKFAAADIAFAEDAVILHGAGAGPFFEKLHIDQDNPLELPEQEGLFNPGQGDVTKPILDSILEGIQILQQNGQFGDYCAIVSPTLFREAYTPRQSPLDAPIYQIEPLLRKNGFLYSEAADGKRGVIFSLARSTINLAVPKDTYVERLTDDEFGQPRFRVAQQFRLVVDDTKARVALQ